MMNQIKDEIIEWNNKFPVDRWWRDRHGIPFMSSAHREASFFDMLFEFEEQKIFNSFFEKTQYLPNDGDWISTSNQTIDQRVSSLAEETRRELKKFNSDARQ